MGKRLREEPGHGHSHFPQVQSVSLTAEFHGLWDSLVYDVEVKSHVSPAFPQMRDPRSMGILDVCPVGWPRVDLLAELPESTAKTLALHSGRRS